MSDLSILDTTRTARPQRSRDPSRRGGLGALRLPLPLIFAVNMSLASAFSAFVIATYF